MGSFLSSCLIVETLLAFHSGASVPKDHLMPFKPAPIVSGNSTAQLYRLNYYSRSIFNSPFSFYNSYLYLEDIGQL